ncbi:MAG: hypothetical protein IJC07_06430 [Clostridia bacterium]|nr:hypothetical protein [Clostridia bacterium]
MKRILCFGDSNTWGYISGTDHLRYGTDKRWTRLLQKNLDGKCEVIEEGLNSRTFFSVDNRPGREGRVGFDYLKPCLDTHDKIDFFVLMLGTNELKNSYNNTASEILAMFVKFVNVISQYKSQIDKSAVKLIVSGIPVVNDETEYAKEDGMYHGARIKSIEYNKLAKEYCLSNNITYLENVDLEVGIDGVHLTEQSHKMLAERLAKAIEEQL